MQYDAVAFLERLFRPPDEGPNPAAAPVPAVTPADLPADWYLLWDERAAIMEYEGGMTKEHAEAAALQDILRRMKAAGIPPPYA